MRYSAIGFRTHLLRFGTPARKPLLHRDSLGTKYKIYLINKVYILYKFLQDILRHIIKEKCKTLLGFGLVKLVVFYDISTLVGY